MLCTQDDPFSDLTAAAKVSSDGQYACVVVATLVNLICETAGLSRVCLIRIRCVLCIYVIYYIIHKYMLMLIVYLYVYISLLCESTRTSAAVRPASAQN